MLQKIPPRNRMAAVWAGSFGYIFGGQEDKASGKIAIYNDVCLYGLRSAAPKITAAFTGPLRGQTSIVWEPPDSRAYISPITEYRIYRGSGMNKALLAAVDGGIRSYVDSGLPDNTAAWYSISAVNAEGESFISSEKQARTAWVPSAPRKPSVGLTASGVRVSWEAPSTNGGLPIQLFSVYRQVDGRPYDLISQTAASTFSVIDQACPFVSRCGYIVAAVNEIGEGQWGNAGFIYSPYILAEAWG